MKVKAKNDIIKKQEKHPTGGGFRDDGTAEWPADTYTFRRLQDGDITATEVGGEPPALHAPAPTPPVAASAEPPTVPPVPAELRKSKTTKEA
jgi:hypothetical protein